MRFSVTRASGIDCMNKHAFCAMVIGGSVGGLAAALELRRSARRGRCRNHGEPDDDNGVQNERHEMGFIAI